MNPDLRSVLSALRKASPVVVDVPADVRYQLMRRYVDVSVRNSRLALLSFALILFGVAHEAPLLAVFPGLAIAFAVLGLNLLGDGLRDLLDPRLARAR